VAPALKQRQHKGDGTSKKITAGWKGGEEGPQPIPSKRLIQREPHPISARERIQGEGRTTIPARELIQGESRTLYRQGKGSKERAAPYTSKRKDPRRWPHHYTRLNKKEPQQNLRPRLGLEEGKMNERVRGEVSLL
jgi:hypothetical protein